MLCSAIAAWYHAAASRLVKDVRGIDQIHISMSSSLPTFLVCVWCKFVAPVRDIMLHAEPTQNRGDQFVEAGAAAGWARSLSCGLAHDAAPCMALPLEAFHRALGLPPVSPMQAQRGGNFVFRRSSLGCYRRQSNRSGCGVSCGRGCVEQQNTQPLYLASWLPCPTAEGRGNESFGASQRRVPFIVGRSMHPGEGQKPNAVAAQLTVTAAAATRCVSIPDSIYTHRPRMSVSLVVRTTPSEAIGSDWSQAVGWEKKDHPRDPRFGQMSSGTASLL